MKKMMQRLTEGQKTSDYRSCNVSKSTRNESIDLKKSVESFPDTMDCISTQTTQCPESTSNKNVCHFYWRFNVSKGMLNTDISNQNVKSMPENVELDEDNDVLVIESGSSGSKSYPGKPA